MAKGGGGGPPKEPGAEATFIVGAIILLLIGWLIWTQARPVIIYPLFGMSWGEYWILNKIGHLNPEGQRWWAYVTACLDGRRDQFTISWSDIMEVLGDIGQRCSLVLALLTGACATVAALRMRGDGLRRIFTLTGRTKQTVHRLCGWKGAHGILSFMKSFSWYMPPRWIYEILKITKMTTSKDEWVQNGVSFAHLQASHWKVAKVGALFDPDKNEKNEAQSVTPMEWLRDNNVALTKREHLDEDAAAKAFEKQLGPVWQGIEKSPVHAQAIAVLAALNVMQDRRGDPLREKLTEIYVEKSLAAAEIEIKKIIAPYMTNKEIVGRINKFASKHAFQNTAMIGLVGCGGPIKEWGGGEAGVLAPASFRWLKKVDRTLWYCLNNVGRRAFHIEGAGAVSHFFAERVSLQALTEPNLDGALEGILTYIDEHYLEDLESHFRSDKRF